MGGIQVIDIGFGQDMTNQPENVGTEPNGLHEAIRTLTSNLSLEMVLQQVADLSRELVSATYSALGILGEDGSLVQFITSGICQSGRGLIGDPPEGKGILGIVLNEGQSLRLHDLNQHSETAGFPANHPPMKSFLGVPIIFKGKVLGNLYLTDKIGADEFSADDENIVTLFAAQAAVAIENARLFGTETRRSSQLDVLNLMGRELTRIFDLDRLLEKVSELLREGFQYQNVQILWVDLENNAIQVRALAGSVEGKIPLGDRRPLDRGIAAWVARTGQTALCNDVREDSRYYAVAGFETAAELAVPVMVKDETVAVINVDGAEPYIFDDSDVKTLETLADQLAVAMENINLLSQQQDQSQRLAVADERDRIGRDLHDGVIQSMYAVGLTLEDIAGQSGKEPESVQPRLEGVVNDLNQVIGDIRRYIMDLRPTELQGRRLEDALASLVGYLEDRAGVSVAVNLDLDPALLPERYFVNIWHILQESFSNIEKYAHAKKVSVSLAICDGDIRLTITDDGDGFDLETSELGRGYGLPNIKDRAERLGGILYITSSPGAGTNLDIKVPVPIPTAWPPLV
ncbi:MAG: GAF domain-containing sensor histidine kinase [SAR202 cluster bacterium]|jgi:signal transduction histidine kinase|nr:GAF domain-containing sensor histidine kinase [SAR202 cluster bacterium]|tara:strand:+ start:190 stop:1908 length:1719 start_codon:yes stop_codon:yes gene_type:complete